MDFAEYQQCAERTLQCEMTDLELKCNCVFGLVGETGEIADLLKKHIFHKHPLDHQKLRDELGDVLWYVAALCIIYEIPLDAVARENVAKLAARYPNGFTYEDSIKRVQ